ncbi:MAG TPA: hypothetical protein DCY70_04325 [Shewanella sp.]|nr:hypothetical protein [Shewanella sp.]
MSENFTCGLIKTMKLLAGQSWRCHLTSNHQRNWPYSAMKSDHLHKKQYLTYKFIDIQLRYSKQGL